MGAPWIILGQKMVQNTRFRKTHRMSTQLDAAVTAKVVSRFNSIFSQVIAENKNGQILPDGPYLGWELFMFQPLPGATMLLHVVDVYWSPYVDMYIDHISDFQRQAQTSCHDRIVFTAC